MDNQPYPITKAEWKEIASLDSVREVWGLEDEADPLEFESHVYGARFNFFSGGPGYVGDIYVLQGDALSERPPLVLQRNPEGHLSVC